MALAPAAVYAVEELTYAVKRGRRRTFAVSVRPDGRITAHAPRWALNPAIHRFVREQLPWLRRTLTRLQEEAARQPKFRLEDGASLPLWGRSVTLRLLSTLRRGVQCRSTGTTLDLLIPPAGASLERQRRAILEEYRRQLAVVLPDRIAFWSAQIGAEPRRVSIGFARHRWGSCSRHHDLRFNARLAMHPPELLDYVVVHELAHTLHLNHSARFWRAVESVMPDHKAKRRRLLIASRATAFS